MFSASDTLEFKLEGVTERILPLEVVHSGYLYPVSLSLPMPPEISIKALSLISFDLIKLSALYMVLGLREEMFVS